MPISLKLASFLCGLFSVYRCLLTERARAALSRHSPRWGECRERARFEDIIVDRRRTIIDINIAEIGWEGLLDWIDVAGNG